MTADSDNPFQSLSAPAQRALANSGIGNAQDLARFTRKEIAALHGIGPSAFPTLEAILEREGLAFKDPD